MLADPCGATLMPGMYGTAEGLCARLRSVINLAGTGSATCGYILWCADYHTGGQPSYGPIVGGNIAGENLFLWTHSDPAHQPENGLNIVATPYGSTATSAPSIGGDMASASAFPDPAHELLSDDIVQDARMLSACIQLTYTGKLQDSSGRIGFVNGLPLDALISGGASGLPPSVSELFQYVNRSQRLGVDSFEVLARVGSSSHKFKDANDAPCFYGTTSAGNHACEQTALGDAQQPVFFGFVWTGLDAAATNPLTLSMTKNIEWRARPRSGLTHQRPITMHANPPASFAQSILDRIDPEWDNRSGPEASTAKSAFTGIESGVDRRMQKWRNPGGYGKDIASFFAKNVMSGVMSSGAQRIGRALMGPIEEALPMLEGPGGAGMIEFVP